MTDKHSITFITAAVTIDNTYVVNNLQVALQVKETLNISRNLLRVVKSGDNLLCKHVSFRAIFLDALRKLLKEKTLLQLPIGTNLSILNARWSTL